LSNTDLIVDKLKANGHDTFFDSTTQTIQYNDMPIVRLDDTVQHMSEENINDLVQWLTMRLLQW
jgi:hypothetical protein